MVSNIIEVAAEVNKNQLGYKISWEKQFVKIFGKKVKIYSKKD